VIVRLLERDDIDWLLDLFDEVAAERVYIGTEPGYDRERYRAQFEAAVGNEESPAFVACIDGRVIAQLSIWKHDEYGMMLSMMVTRRRRGTGVGRALLASATDWARSHAVPSLSLLVFPHNEGALALYRATGFLEIERFENDVVRQDGAIWDSILMRKTIE
jgi:GNAT superfamily N-acetyltransferase